mmetsp:Transcript_27801/g.74886  ORF Transcript_27801/g.74886 Transcript_27801/m.74886 type:complete len:206 (+) Transcript_27801:734-1351(+)
MPMSPSERPTSLSFTAEVKVCFWRSPMRLRASRGDASTWSPPVPESEDTPLTHVASGRGERRAPMPPPPPAPPLAVAPPASPNSLSSFGLDAVPEMALGLSPLDPWRSTPAVVAARARRPDGAPSASPAPTGVEAPAPPRQVSPPSPIASTEPEHARGRAVKGDVELARCRGVEAPDAPRSKRSGAALAEATAARSPPYLSRSEK